MRRFFMFLLLCVVGFNLRAAAQNSCPASTVATVLGTTCTIGDLSFTFGVDFNGFRQFNPDGPEIFTEPISPTEIGFTPVTQGDQSGFTLTGNFDEPGLLFFSSHFAGFPYTIQTLGTNLITEQTGILVGTIGGTNTVSIAGFDQQCSGNFVCSTVGPTINFTPQFGLFSEPVQTSTFPAPVCRSESGQHAFNSFAFIGATAFLNTSTILYKTGLPPGPQSTPPITDLGTFGGSQSFAAGLNKYGQVVGQANTRCDETGHAFRWQDGTLTDLGTLGGTFSFAIGISKHGKVVGSSDLASGPGLHAFLWSGGTMRDLGTLGGGDSSAIAINDRDQVVGQSQVDVLDPNTGAPAWHAFLWQNNLIADLGTLGGSNSFGGGVNKQGQIVGVSDISSDPHQNFGTPVFHSFLWQNGVMTDLGQVLGGDFNFSNAINESGQIVGGANLPGETLRHAFIWQDGKAQDLGTLPSDEASFAFAVNNKGQVVGMSAQSFDGGGSFFYSCPCHAVLWKEGQVIDLNTFVPPGSGWELFAAEAINEKGQIAGQALRNGNSVSFLLTLPETAEAEAQTSITALDNKSVKVGSVKGVSMDPKARKLQIQKVKP